MTRNEYQRVCDTYNTTCKALGITARMGIGSGKGWLYIQAQGGNRLPCRYAAAVEALEGRRRQLARKQDDDAKLAALRPAPEHKRYKQMNRDQFMAALKQVGIDSMEFAYITGADPRRTRRWLNGDETSIPHWVTLVCTLLLDGRALSVARDMAKKMNIEEKESA